MSENKKIKEKDKLEKQNILIENTTS